MRLINLLSSGLILVGLIILILIFFPVAQEEINYQVKKFRPQEYIVVESPWEVEQAKKQEAESITFRQKLIIPVSFDFSLVIPKIGVNSEVFANINSADAETYLPILKKGVAHALASSLPNESGPVFIFAHSTDVFYNIFHYNAVFFLLSKLEKNDEVLIFYQNKKYLYKVVDKRIIEPNDIPSEVTNLKNQNVLILQTCWPPGTTVKRLLVIAKNVII